MREARPGLPDRYGFWLGTAAVSAALGAIGITIAVAEYHPPWSSAWFIGGSLVCAVGCMAVVWALVLYLARKEAGGHWCPNPRAHVAEAGQQGPADGSEGATSARVRAILRAADAVCRGESARWLRPVLREINGDLRQAAAGIERARRDRSYSGVRHEFEIGQTWEDNRQRLAALQGRGDLYDRLRDAYAGISRIRRIASRSGTVPTEAQDLIGILDAIREAEVTVGKELAQLG